MNFEKGSKVLAARYLIGARVVAGDGRQLGHVIDMEIDPERNFLVLSVELGRHGWIDRMRALRPLAHDRLSAPPRIVAWEDIERYEDGTLHCKPGARVREMTAPLPDDATSLNRTDAGG